MLLLTLLPPHPLVLHTSHTLLRREWLFSNLEGGGGGLPPERLRRDEHGERPRRRRWGVAAAAVNVDNVEGALLEWCFHWLHFFEWLLPPFERAL